MTALFQDGGLRTASRMAREVDDLTLLGLGITLLFGIGILVALVAFCIRYRRGAGRHDPTITRGRRLELLWLTGPLLINLVLFWLGAGLFTRAASVPADALPIYVIGRQWMWEIQHPSGRAELNHLTVPRGRNVVLQMISEDVIHSFYVPALRTKRDLYPGRFTSLWFAADRVGEYPLLCAEYCGTQHAGMIGTVRVVEPEEYERWCAGAERAPLAERGAELFEEHGCAACHGGADDASGPHLRRRFAATGSPSPQRLLRSILDPAAEIRGSWPVGMPSYRGVLDEPEMVALVHLLRTFGEAD